MNARDDENQIEEIRVVVMGRLCPGRVMRG